MNPIQWFENSNNPHQRGHIAELLVAAELTSKGHEVSFTPCTCRFDLIASKDQANVRIQVKLAYMHGNGWRFKATRGGGGKGRIAYKDEEFDWFAVVIPDPLNPSICYYPNTEDMRGTSDVQLDDDLRLLTELPNAPGTS